MTHPSRRPLPPPKPPSGNKTDGQERRTAKTILEYWPLIVVSVGGIVTAITFWNNVNGLVADQKEFKKTVDTRKDAHQKESEDIRIRLTKLEQWKDDVENNRGNGGTCHDR